MSHKHKPEFESSRSAKRRKLANRYVLGDEIGSGSNGRVFVAVDEFTQEVVAVKETKLVNGWEYEDTEGKLQSLAHATDPHAVVGLLDSIQVKGALYHVLEKFDANLTQVLELASKIGEKPSEKEIKVIMFNVLKAVHACHLNGFVHCDVKTDNVFLKADSTMKLGDFSNSLQLTSFEERTKERHQSLDWRAPELLSAEEKVISPSADIWSCGCLLVRLLTGELPFGADEASGSLFEELKRRGVKVDSEEFHREIDRDQFRRIFHKKSDKCYGIDPRHPAITLIQQMLLWNWRKRPSAEECLRHPYFWDLLMG